MTLTVSRPHQGEFAWSVTIAPDVARDEAAADQIQGVIAGAETGESVQLWIEHVTDHDDAFAADLGFEPYRDLWRMQRPLPAPRATI
ncbi:MAG: hypothetical protein OXI29_08210, partial [bacterium]|nr:hypothetical protein [bacterium]